jgi:hypothetical protein
MKEFNLSADLSCKFGSSTGNKQKEEKRENIDALSWMFKVFHV